MIPILDNGHGGLINGIYQTPGKRSPNWKYGVLYEGVFNRKVVNRLIEKLNENEIPYYHVSPELSDMHLFTRKTRANMIYGKNKNTYLLSIHANAGGGEGLEFFTSRGETKSDEICEKLINDFDKYRGREFKIRKDYTDGDADKEADFYIIKKTKCPAVLIELGFMDNLKDYERLNCDIYINSCVNIIYRFIVKQYVNSQVNG